MSPIIVACNSSYCACVIPPHSNNLCHFLSWSMHWLLNPIFFPSESVPVVADAISLGLVRIGLFGGTSYESCLFRWIRWAQALICSAVYILECFSRQSTVDFIYFSEFLGNRFSLRGFRSRTTCRWGTYSGALTQKGHIVVIFAIAPH